jgi:hypothetical protein
MVKEGVDALNTPIWSAPFMPMFGGTVLCGVELPTPAAYCAQWDCAAASMDNST